MRRKDQQYVAVGAIEAKFYDELLAGLGLEGATCRAVRSRAWPATKAFAATFNERTRDEWTEIFAGADACVTPVLSPREAARHPYNTSRDVFSLEGDVQPQPAPRFSKTPGGHRSSRVRPVRDA